MDLWTPPGADLGGGSPPLPDDRMINFLGLNGPAHSGYHELRRQASAWPVTDATPSATAELLSTSRDLYAQGYYCYPLLTVGGTWSIFAVEAALREKLSRGGTEPLHRLVKLAKREGLLPRPGWDNDRLDAGRKLRNKLVHSGKQQLWTPAMARMVIASSHEAVAALFPDTECGAA